jgi:L-lactate dehydrogenase complex protein LldG
MSPDARTAILERVRRAAPGRVPHPGPHPSPGLPGGFALFAATLASVGGEAHGPVPAARLGDTVVALIDAWGERGRVVAEPEAAGLLGPGRWETAEDDAPPASFGDVGVAIVPGSIGVAENAAVAVERARAPHRALHFLCQRLVLLLPGSAIVPDLHTAFARLAATGRSPAQVTWVSGPSKTADIEQALVYGAHGPLAAAVVAFEDPA